MGEESKQQPKNNGSGAPFKRTLAGGILGATFGYLATPENGKKLLARVDKEAIKTRTMEIGRSAKENSKRAAQNFKTSTADFLSRSRGQSEASPETEVSATTEEIDTEELEDLREENQKLQKRLKSLEEKMDQLLDDDDEDDVDEGNSANQNKTSSSTRKKQTKKTKTEEDSEKEDSEDSTEVKQKKEAEKKSNNNTNGNNKTKPKKDKEDENDTKLTSDDDTSS